LGKEERVRRFFFAITYTIKDQSKLAT